MWSGFSKNSLNWIILKKIVTDEFTSLSRELLTYYISPKQLPDYFKGCLQKTLKLIFNWQQEKLILESCTDGYDKLDLAVLLQILKRICSEEIKNDLKVLQSIRNVLSHLPSTDINTEDFNGWFAELCRIGRAIEEHLKRPPRIERTLIAIRDSCLQRFHFEDNANINEEILYVREATNEFGAERINVLPSINSCVGHDSTNPNVEKEALDTTVDCTVKRPHLDGTKKNQTPGRNNNDISQEVFIAPALDRDKDLPQSPAQDKASHKHLDLSQRDNQHKAKEIGECLAQASTLFIDSLKNINIQNRITDTNKDLLQAASCYEDPQTDINYQGLTTDGDKNPVQAGSSPQKEVVHMIRNFAHADTQDRISHKDIDLAQAATQQHRGPNKDIDLQNRTTDPNKSLAEAATQHSDPHEDLDPIYKTKTKERDKGLVEAATLHTYSDKNIDHQHGSKDRDNFLGQAATQQKDSHKDIVPEPRNKTDNNDLAQVATQHKISHKDIDPQHRTKDRDKYLVQANTQKHKDSHKDIKLIDPQHRSKDPDKDFVHGAYQNRDSRKEIDLSQTDSHLMSKDRDESLIQSDKYFVQTASSTQHKTFNETKDQASTHLRTINRDQVNRQRDTYSIKSLSERDSKRKNIQKDQIALHEEWSLPDKNKKSEVLLLKNIRTLKGENREKISDQHSNEKSVVETGPSWKEQRELGQAEKNNCKENGKDKGTNAYEALGVELRDEESEEFLKIYADMSDKSKDQQKMDFDRDLVILHPEKPIDCQLAQNYLCDLQRKIDVSGELYENVMCPGERKLDVQPLLHFRYVFVLITPFYEKSRILQHIVDTILLESIKNCKTKVVPVLMEEWCKFPLELRPIQPLKFYKTFGENSDKNYYLNALDKLFKTKIR